MSVYVCVRMCYAKRIYFAVGGVSKLWFGVKYLGKCNYTLQLQMFYSTYESNMVCQLLFFIRHISNNAIYQEEQTCTLNG
jgi:hypothetical protein